MNITEKFGLFKESKSVKSLKKLTEDNRNLIDTMNHHEPDECTEQETLEIVVFVMIGLILCNQIIEECDLEGMNNKRVFEIFCLMAVGELK